jgi:hypothetical protein
MDRDGKADLLWQEPVDGRIRFWTMNGNRCAGTRAPGPEGPTDASWSLVGATDLDGDGQSDLVFRNSRSGRSAFWLLDQGLRRRTALLLPPDGPEWLLVAWLPAAHQRGGTTLVLADANGALRFVGVSPNGSVTAERRLPGLTALLHRQVVGPR